VSRLPAKPRNSLFVSSCTRRTVIVGLGASALGACSPSLDLPELDDVTTGSIPIRPRIGVDSHITTPDVMYASFTDDGFVLQAIPYDKVPRDYRRQIVVDPTGERSSSSLPNVTSITSWPAARRSVTALASAATVSAGPAAPTSSMARNGRCGRPLPR